MFIDPVERAFDINNPHNLIRRVIDLENEIKELKKQVQKLNEILNHIVDSSYSPNFDTQWQ